MATIPADQLTPIVDVRTRPRFRDGRPEIWEARSADGQWTFLRTEEPGTPWVVQHTPTDRWYYTSTLAGARNDTFTGAALLHLETLDEEVTPAAG